MSDLLYNENNLMSMPAIESAASIPFLYRHFLSGITEKSLNAFYYACSYAKADYSGFMDITAGMALKLLPYQDEVFSEYRTESVQEFRFALSRQIREQVFYAIFVKNIETHIKSNTIMNALKQLVQKQGYHL